MKNIKQSFFLKTAFLVILSLINHVLTGQIADKAVHKFRVNHQYLSSSLGYKFGKGITAGFSYTVELSNPWSINFSIHSASFDPKDLPDNYSLGDFGFFNEKPKDLQFSYSLNFGRHFYLDHSRKILSIEIGPSYMINKKFRFSNPHTEFGWFGNSTVYDESIDYLCSAGFNARINLYLLMFKSFGMSYGLFTEINPNNKLAGMEISILLGEVGK